MKGTGVWISTCGRGGREWGWGGDRTTVFTETLLSRDADMEGQGEEGDEGVMWGLPDRWADSRK